MRSVLVNGERGEIANPHFSPQGKKYGLNVYRVIIFISKHIIDILFQYFFFTHFFQLLARQGPTYLAQCSQTLGSFLPWLPF